MKNTTQIIDHFLSTALPFAQLKQYSNVAGIYAIHYYGDSFNIGFITGLEAGQIIYIGKTLSSQQDRDVDTHFKTGKTGSSTVRRSIGALLRKELNLVPIPRSKNKTSKDCVNYRFDEKSEEALTKWMTENLGLSFFQYPESPEKIKEIEICLIQQIIPCLNIDSNSLNPYLTYLKNTRAFCRREVEKYSGSNKSVIPVQKSSFTLNYKSHNQNTMHKYENIWKLVLPVIKETLRNGSSLNNVSLDKAQFDAAGNRKSYSFNIQYENGRLSNDLSGSAVARDLDRLIMNDLELKQLLKGKNLKLGMGKDFVFKIFLN